MTDTKAPERIWATPDETGHTQDCGEWDRFDSDNPNATKYIRADLYNELIQAAEKIASLPIRGHLPDNVPVTGVDGRYITQWDVKIARAALAKAQCGNEPIRHLHPA